MSRERVLELIEAAEVERITADLAMARRMLEDAGRHLTCMSSFSQVRESAISA